RGASALRGYLREAAWRALARFGPAAGVAALFAFGQFEVPSLAALKTRELWGRPVQSAWTVALFDAHADMQSLGGSLRLAVPAVLVQLAGLVPLLMWLQRRPERGWRDERQNRFGLIARTVATLGLGAAVGLTVGIPIGVLAWETGLSGWKELAESSWRLNAFLPELRRSLLIGAAAAAVAGGLIWAVSFIRGTVGTTALVLLIAPGLCGPLVAALLVKWLVTTAAADGWPGGRALQESYLPLTAAIALSLLPRAALLRAFSPGRTSARHLVRLLRAGTRSQRRAAGRLWWGLVGRSLWLRWGLLALWGSADISAAALLAPAGGATAMPGLYGLMHYGHNAALGALSLIATVLPAGLLAAGAFVVPKLATLGRTS
ncbi:MAG: hypothetical protein AAF907_14055, partial [Planctomycetota bacterium]